MNLPTKFTQGANTIEIQYDASGKKLKKILSGGTTKSYIGSFEYVGTAVEALYHSEGRARNNSGTYVYEYVIKDHLGNSRVMFTNTSGAIAQIQENHYYPFGLEQAGWIANPTPPYAYKYNGKELNVDFGLNLSDYGARWYDAGVGRFTSGDPISEIYSYQSAFVYAENNPIKYIDYMGFGSSYNWKASRYEDENGYEVSWNNVQEEYGLSKASITVNLLNEDDVLSTKQLTKIAYGASQIFDKNDLTDLVSYKLVNSEEYYNSGTEKSTNLGFRFYKGALSPMGRTVFLESDWGATQDLKKSFINLRSHLNSNGSYNIESLSYTLAHETLHGLLAKSSYFMTRRRNDIIGSEDFAGHYNSYPNLLNEGNSQYGGRSDHILSIHVALF
ncbi:MAG: RHS repeat-associated core domain-containing protein [Saprospiraceae bacterium]|nr:RHS repeat-associated core domain-containing protein [Saprospiraceae bacterium]